MCIDCHNEKKRDNGWQSFATLPKSTLCRVTPAHGDMVGPFEEKDLRLVAELQARPTRRPDIDKISQFFAHNMPAPQPLDQFSINFVLYAQNKDAYFNELRLRVKGMRPQASDDDINTLWDLLIDTLQQKSTQKAKDFLQQAKKIGLAPLEEPSPRIFWSGKNSRAHVYNISGQPPNAAALEKTDVGVLLDKLKVFEIAPWEVSTVLWALVSRYFGIGASCDAHAYLDGGFAKGNVFWNDELPALRLMQRYGAVKKIYMHIYHTRDQRWVKEFEFGSDQLLLVFDKAKRVAKDPPPTDPTENKTRSYRYDKPIKVATLTRLFERYLKRPTTVAPEPEQPRYRDVPLILYSFRLTTGIFGRLAQRRNTGIDVELFEYDSDDVRRLVVEGNGSDAAFARLRVAEWFLIKNYKLFTQLPQELNVGLDAIIADGRIQAVKRPGSIEWWYKLPFVRDFSCSAAEAQAIIHPATSDAALNPIASKFKRTTLTSAVSQIALYLTELFDNTAVPAPARVAALVGIMQAYPSALTKEQKGVLEDKMDVDAGIEDVA
jgi:hypothetical protein